MDHRITFKESLFLLPVLILLGIFSVYSICQTAIYSFFDYQLSDPVKNGMYLSSQFNASLFEEDLKYIRFYTGDDAALAPDEASADGFAELDRLCDEGFALLAELGIPEDETKCKLSSEQFAALQTLAAGLDAAYEAAYSSADAADAAFYNADAVRSVVSSLGDCFIESNFVGVNQYVKVLRDTRFWKATWNTFLFTLVSVSLEFVLGLTLAMIMNRKIRGIGIIRATALVPWALPTVVSALIWSYLFNGTSGIVSYLFAQIGLIPTPENLLLSSTGAMASAIIADVWKTTPYVALLLLAGLQTIDHGLYESSMIDGATNVQRFFHVTLPLLRPTILVALLFRTLDAFRVYDLITVLTGGGPGGATETLSIYSQKTMFGQTDFGYGSVIVVMTFLFVAVIAFIFIKVLGTGLVSDD